MPTSPVRSLIDHIRTAMPPEGDGDLLGRFVDRRDERALAALVDRHGPMVWGVCRRLLSHHDAEDAFQATFIVLVRKADAIRPREMVGNWLYGVARQAALQARAAARRRERQVDQMPDAEAPQDRWADVRPILDEELSRLPDHYRAVIVLSDLEGKTRRDVALRLGCPEGTVASRLARARAMLAKRLTGRGVALSGGALASALSPSAASAGVPTSVVTSTIKAASQCAAGQAAVSLQVAALTEGVLKAMLVIKLKSVTGMLVVAALVGVIGLGLAQTQPKSGEAQKPASEKAPKEEIVKAKPAVAWGQEVDGMQLGLVADAGTCRLGEKLKLTMKLRNVGKVEVTVTYGVLQECTPQVTTGTGGRVSVYMPPPFDNFAVPIKRTLKPGETITLYSPEVAVESEDRAKLDGELRVETPTICVPPGKYKIGYSGMIQSHPTLATGIVDVEVKDQVAWGKEAGGLQAGMVIRNAADIRIGGKVQVDVKLRNVSKEPIKVWVWPLWTCYPGVVDGTGERAPTTRAPSPDFDISPKAITLKPGETVDVGRSDLIVAAPDQKVAVPDGVVDFCAIHVKPGMHKADCVGFLKENHTLATGSVEFEVKAAKEGVTAWGKEVGGLQAGLGYKAGEKRAYGQGETVTLVVRVRNVSKEAVKFRYCRETFFENPPTLTDAKGNLIPLERDRASGSAALVPVNLEPGKEIEVGERQLELKPALYATGKFRVQYEALETAANDKTLSQLATGRLELEVKDKAPDSESSYPTADIVVQYRDGSGRDLKQFRVEDAETVAKLASHFSGILGEKGSGPRASVGNRATLTIKFNHKGGEASQMRVVHIPSDYATWQWRDNTPYTGDRQVEKKDKLQGLMERLAAKAKVDLK